MKYLSFVLLILVASCKSKHTSKESKVVLYHPSFNPGPHVLVYKTSGDYYKNVAILLSNDGKEILSYPHPNDINSSVVDVYPSQLNKGYLIDNRGISKQTKFLIMTYSEYSKLDSLPSLNTLKSWMINNSSVTEICDCGDKSGYSNVVEQINAIINQDSLYSICKKM